MMPDEEDRGTILYVEDTPDNRTLVRRVLMAEGYTVVEAPSASIALETLKTLTPNLILMDINMPEMDGYTLTAKIRAMPQFNKVPIIALTANVMKGDRERSLEAGCDGYIQKPIDIDTITTQIERFLKVKR
jgi:two-component system, cell cycle response regulator DivK